MSNLTFKTDDGREWVLCVDLVSDTQDGGFERDATEADLLAAGFVREQSSPKPMADMCSRCGSTDFTHLSLLYTGAGCVAATYEQQAARIAELELEARGKDDMIAALRGDIREMKAERDAVRKALAWWVYAGCPPLNPEDGSDAAVEAALLAAHLEGEGR